MRSPLVQRLSKASGIALLVALACTLIAPAFADPPSHAPAHGWRKKHDPYYLGYTGKHWEHDYGILEGRCNREAIGAVVGGVVGGAIGSQVGDGSGRTVAVVLGAVLGAVIGREIGRNLDEQDRACVGHALELAKDGQGVRWMNEKTGVSYVVKPLGKARDDTCRTFELIASLDGKSRTQQGNACRTGDGTWQMRQ